MCEADTHRCARAHTLLRLLQVLRWLWCWHTVLSLPSLLQSSWSSLHSPILCLHRSITLPCACLLFGWLVAAACQSLCCLAFVSVLLFVWAWLGAAVKQTRLCLHMAHPIYVQCVHQCMQLQNENKTKTKQRKSPQIKNNSATLCASLQVG